MRGNGVDLQQAVSGLTSEVAELSKLVRTMNERQDELFLLIKECSLLGEKVDRVVERVTQLEAMP